MANSRTPWCPNCNFAFELMSTAKKPKYGCPIQICPRCNYIVYYPDIIEWEAFSVEQKNQYIKKKKVISAIKGLLIGLISSICFIGDSYVTSGLSKIFLIVFITLLFGSVIAFFLFTHEKSKILKAKEDSIERLQDPSYALCLKKFGYNVPDKFITN